MAGRPKGSTQYLDKHAAAIDDEIERSVSARRDAKASDEHLEDLRDTGAAGWPTVAIKRRVARRLAISVDRA